MRLFLVAALAAAALSTGAAAQGPSFNCDHALSDSEVAICRYPALARLDAEHELLFSRTLAATPGAAQPRLHRDHAAWRAFRDACGGDGACIARRYEARIGELGRERDALGLHVVPGPTARILGGPELRAQPVEVPDLQRLGRILTDRPDPSGRLVLNPLESLAVLATEAADPASVPAAATVDPDGTIRKPLGDGRTAYYNPVTGDRGYVNPDGTTTRLMLMEVQPDTLPALPPDYGGWSASVSQSLAGLVGNLLTVQEARTLQSNAPADFFENLDFQLRVLAFITG